jgi:hypothetical protein
MNLLDDIPAGVMATAEKAADLRARYGVRLHDACQIAVALAASATLISSPTINVCGA